MSRNPSHSTAAAISAYRKQYAPFKTLLLYSFDGVEDKLEIIRDHPNFSCIHLPAIYSRLISNQPKRRSTRLEIRARKLAALDDVLSFLDSLSFGVIR